MNLIQELRRIGRRNAAAAFLWGRFRWHTSPAGLRQIVRRIRHLGWAVRCPICGWRGRAFYPYGVGMRPNAMCPRCYGVERHRSLYFYLAGRTDPQSVLEIGPGPYSYRMFGRRAGDLFVGIDVKSPLANCLCDVMHLAIARDIFDLVVCYHVLEHVPDDRRALCEMLRVLKPGGVALIQVPIDREVTFEIKGASSVQERARLFGQSDHLRAYGLDFKDRLRAAGFVVHVESFVQELSPRMVQWAALDPAERVYACHKPVGNSA